MIIEKGYRILRLLNDPVGRSEIRFHLLRRLWPLLRFTAYIYRKWIIHDVKVVVVIGSLGKSTTTGAIRCVLGLPQNRYFSSNAWSALALKVLRIRPGQKYDVIEVGIGSSGQMEKYAAMIRPDVVVVTSIASEHTGIIGSIEKLRKEKSFMLSVLSANDMMIFNADDLEVRQMKEETKAKKTAYGFSPDAVVRCLNCELNWPAGMKVSFMLDGDCVSFQTSLFARHMVYPLLAAVSVAHISGIKKADAVRRLEGFRSPSGRMNLIRLDNGSLLIRDDYKATYETIEPALEFFGQVPAKRKILVLGDSIEMPKPWQMGCRKIGNQIAGVADLVFLIGNMETEYSSGIFEAGLNRENVFLSGNDWKNAFRHLPGDLGEDDVILVKGLANQRFQRFSLALLGEKVECSRSWCEVKSVRCENCLWKYSPDNTFYARKTIQWERF